MIPFFDHHSAKQFLPMKPIHYGFKMFCLNQLSGCCFQFEPYPGKSAIQSETMQAYQGKFGLGGATVLSLLDTMDEACGVLYLDNFTTSQVLNFLENCLIEILAQPEHSEKKPCQEVSFGYKH